MGMKNSFNRGRATVGILGALVGAGNGDVLKNSSTSLNKQYGQYAKEVRLPATRRDIERQLDQATRNKNKPTTSINTKGLKGKK